MAGTYGAAGTNTYTIPGVGGILSNEVNSTTGVTQVYRGGAFTTQQSLGTYNPSTKTFTPTAGNVTPAELTTLRSASGIEKIQTAAVQTATKAGATNAAQLMSPNVAPAAAAGGAAAGGAATAPTTTVEDLNNEVKGKDIRTSYRKDLSYPLNRNAKQDYIRFDMLEYAAKGIEANTLSSLAAGAGVDAATGSPVFGDRASNRTAIGSVSLPISSPISDTNTVNWSDQALDAIQAKAAGEALGLMGMAQSNTQETDAASKQGQSSSDTKKLVGYGLASAAAGGNANLFTRATGAIVNPNLELLFNGPSLRTFSFTFPLSARSEAESKIILQIIRFFKQGMSVKRAKSALFLKSPHTFRIKYVYAGTGKDHPWINKFKECALTNCSVNYTPAGNYATYDNGAMTMYEITLNFSELEPIFDDDYGNTAGDPATDIQQGVGY